MPIPMRISRLELVAAIQPLCDLLGTSPKNFYDSPGITIGDGEITFLAPIAHEEDPSGRAPASRNLSAELPVHPQRDRGVEPVLVGNDPDSAEWAYPIRVEVEPS